MRQRFAPSRNQPNYPNRRLEFHAAPGRNSYDPNLGPVRTPKPASPTTPSFPGRRQASRRRKWVTFVKTMPARPPREAAQKALLKARTEFPNRPGRLDKRPCRADIGRRVRAQEHRLRPEDRSCPHDANVCLLLSAGPRRPARPIRSRVDGGCWAVCKKKERKKTPPKRVIPRCNEIPRRLLGYPFRDAAPCGRRIQRPKGGGRRE